MRRSGPVHHLLLLLAWLGQVWAPIGHAASVSATSPSALLDCGHSVAALAEQIGSLPADLRRALSAHQNASHSASCAQHCASAGGAALPSLPAAWFAQTPSASAWLSPMPQQAPASRRNERPPVRGPPARS